MPTNQPIASPARPSRTSAQLDEAQNLLSNLKVCTHRLLRAGFESNWPEEAKLLDIVNRQIEQLFDLVHDIN